MTKEPDWAGAFADLIRAHFDPGARVVELRRLSSGASRETWSSSVETAGGRCDLILQRRPAGVPGAVIGVGTEADLVRAASRAGVPAPDVIASGDGGDDGLGGAWMLTRLVPGEAIPRRVLDSDRFAPARHRFVSDAADALARLASVDPATVNGLAEVDPLIGLAAADALVPSPSPTFAVAFRWLDDHRPGPSGPATIVHGDFRLGNLLVDEDGLTAVLDWELAHVGDPLEDLGWLCVRAWRFGGHHPVAGIGERSELWAAYEEAGGRRVEPESAHWWEVYGTLRWGVISRLQAWRHLSGRERSLELAAIGRRVCETEWDLLGLLAAEVRPSLPLPQDRSPRADAAADGPSEDRDQRRDGTPPHDAPSAAELVEEALHVLETRVSPELDGRARFESRVVIHALAVVGRELRLGPGPAAWERLGRPGIYSDEALAGAVQQGTIPVDPEVVEALWMTVAAKLAVANPDHAR